MDDISESELSEGTTDYDSSDDEYLVNFKEIDHDDEKVIIDDVQEVDEDDDGKVIGDVREMINDHCSLEDVLEHISIAFGQISGLDVEELFKIVTYEKVGSFDQKTLLYSLAKTHDFIKENEISENIPVLKKLTEILK